MPRRTTTFLLRRGYMAFHSRGSGARAQNDKRKIHRLQRSCRFIAWSPGVWVSILCFSICKPVLSRFNRATPVESVHHVKPMALSPSVRVSGCNTQATVMETIPSGVQRLFSHEPQGFRTNCLIGLRPLPTTTSCDSRTGRKYPNPYLPYLSRRVCYLMPGAVVQGAVHTSSFL